MLTKDIYFSESSQNWVNKITCSQDISQSLSSSLLGRSLYRLALSTTMKVMYRRYSLDFSP